MQLFSAPCQALPCPSGHWNKYPILKVEAARVFAAKAREPREPSLKLPVLRRNNPWSFADEIWICWYLVRGWTWFNSCSLLWHFSTQEKHRQATQKHCQSRDCQEKHGETGFGYVECPCRLNEWSSCIAIFLLAFWYWPRLRSEFLSFARTVPSRLQLVSRLWHESKQVRPCWTGWNIWPHSISQLKVASITN